MSQKKTTAEQSAGKSATKAGSKAAKQSAPKTASKPASKQATPKKKETVVRAYENAPAKETSKKETKKTSEKKVSEKKTTKGELPAGKKKGGKSAPVVETPRSERLIHQALPYIFGVLTLFLCACYLFHDSASKVGVLGGWIYDLFTGLFGWPAFLIPLLLINLAIFWRKYVDLHLVTVKLVLFFCSLVFTSALVQVVVTNKAGEAGYNIVEFWKNGNGSLVGGGVLGGLLGNACWQVMGWVCSLIVLIPGILLCGMFLIGVTPRYVFARSCYLWKLRRERRAEQKAERREREEARIAEEKERLEQQERERYARRLREQREAEAAEEAAEQARRETAKTAPKKGGRAHQNDFIELEESGSGKKNTATRTDNAPLDFTREDDLDGILEENERMARHTPRRINQDVPIRPAEESAAPQAAPKKQNATEDIAMSLARDKETAHGDNAVTIPQKPHRDAAQPTLAVTQEKAMPNGGDDIFAGLTDQQPVRKKREAACVSALKKESDFLSLDDILSLRPTPEQEMKNTPEDAATELVLTPIADEEEQAPAAPRKRTVSAAPVTEPPKTAEKAEKAGPVMTDAHGAPIEEDDEPQKEYVFPSIDFLALDKNPKNEDVTEELRENARRLMETLTDFNVRIKEITYSRGPTITRYELKPDAGIRVRTIANLVDDIALSLATSGVRIEAPIPNKPAVGIEVPNRNRATVYLRDLIDSEKFTEEKSRLNVALGMDVAGKPIYFDISKMPHLLIAGATGMGKSVCINSLIVSLLYKAKPEEVRLILIDPKKVEFKIYRDIPLLYTPIVVEAKRAAAALACAVAEMERRFELIERVGVRDIKGYNEITAGDPEMEHLPHIVIIIDELADLMMVARDQVETSICRIAQKARAAGMHLVIGTQRPSVDVITGVLKANIPSRIACTVASQVDSRTIIDMAGAEKLIGRGDMLFYPVGVSKPQRVQGAFVSDSEVETVVDFVRKNNSKVRYNRAFIENIEAEAARAEANNRKDDDEGEGGGDGDSQFASAVRVAVENKKISTSLLQRKLSIGYGRAAKLIDQMEELGYVGPADGNKPRQIYITKEEFDEHMANGTLEG